MLDARVLAGGQAWLPGGWLGLQQQAILSFLSYYHMVPTCFVESRSVSILDGRVMRGGQLKLGPGRATPHGAVKFTISDNYSHNITQLCVVDVMKSLMSFSRSFVVREG